MERRTQISSATSQSASAGGLVGFRPDLPQCWSAQRMMTLQELSERG